MANSRRIASSTSPTITYTLDACTVIAHGRSGESSVSDGSPGNVAGSANTVACDSICASPDAKSTSIDWAPKRSAGFIVTAVMPVICGGSAMGFSRGTRGCAVPQFDLESRCGTISGSAYVGDMLGGRVRTWVERSHFIPGANATGGWYITNGGRGSQG